MYAFPTLLWVAFGVYLVERLLPLVAPLLMAKHPAPVRVAEPMPVSLVALAEQESEPWAREQMLQAMREAYDETRDWNTVQRRMES